MAADKKRSARVDPNDPRPRLQLPPLRVFKITNLKDKKAKPETVMAHNLVYPVPGALAFVEFVNIEEQAVPMMRGGYLNAEIHWEELLVPAGTSVEIH